MVIRPFTPLLARPPMAEKSYAAELASPLKLMVAVESPPTVLLLT